MSIQASMADGEEDRQWTDRSIHKTLLRWIDTGSVPFLYVKLHRLWGARTPPRDLVKLVPEEEH